jgi:hypothetical protein
MASQQRRSLPFDIATQNRVEYDAVDAELCGRLATVLKSPLRPR